MFLKNLIKVPTALNVLRLELKDIFNTVSATHKNSELVSHYIKHQFGCFTDVSPILDEESCGVLVELRKEINKTLSTSPVMQGIKIKWYVELRGPDTMYLRVGRADTGNFFDTLLFDISDMPKGVKPLSNLSNNLADMLKEVEEFDPFARIEYNISQVCYTGLEDMLDDVIQYCTDVIFRASSQSGDVQKMVNQMVIPFYLIASETRKQYLHRKDELKIRRFELRGGPI